MFGKTRLASLFLVLVALVTASCGTVRSTGVGKLDPETGVTVSRPASPLLFYRDNSSVAAYAREYVHLGPVLVNRMGDDRYFLWLGIWRTHDPRPPAGRRNAFESVALFVDGEPMVLDLVGWSGSAIGVSQPVYQKPVATSVDAYYRISRDQLRQIAGASDIRLQAAGLETYEPWDDQRRAKADLGAFLDASAW